MAPLALPQRPGRPSLAALPTDVVMRLLGLVRASRPDDLLNIALVNRALYQMARYVQHHTLHLDLDTDRWNDTECRLDFISRNGLAPAIRLLRLKCSGCLERRQEARAVLGRLTGLLPEMSGLRDLHWNSRLLTAKPVAPVPPLLLELLAPQVRLHTSVTGSDDSQQQALDYLARLEGNRNLFSLTLYVKFNDHHSRGQCMRLMKRVLLSCPKLVSIPLLEVGYRSEPPHGLIHGPLPTDPYSGMAFFDGERPQALEELGVGHYPWGFAHENGASLAGYPCLGTEWQYWADKFDWSRLRILNESPSNLAEAMAPRLTRLKEARFGEMVDLCWEQAGFLMDMPPGLELLVITSWGSVKNQAEPIAHHGGTLRSLKVHEVEARWKDSSLIDVQGLSDLRDALPHLQELAIDMKRDTSRNKWPYSALDIIAGFPSLRSIELWFALGNGVSGPPPTPCLNVAAARHLWDYVAARNAKVQRLELHSGAPSDTNWTGEPSWATQNSTHLVCQRSDDDAADGPVGVTCPTLNRSMKEKLREGSASAATAAGPFTGDVVDLPLHVALRGPLDMTEWMAWRQLPGDRWQKAQAHEPSKLRRFITAAFRRRR